jgi:hypothetical protein
VEWAGTSDLSHKTLYLNKVHIQIQDYFPSGEDTPVLFGKVISNLDFKYTALWEHNK